MSFSKVGRLIPKNYFHLANPTSKIQAGRFHSSPDKSSLSLKDKLMGFFLDTSSKAAVSDASKNRRVQAGSEGVVAATSGYFTCSQIRDKVLSKPPIDKERTASVGDRQREKEQQRLSPSKKDENVSDDKKEKKAPAHYDPMYGIIF